MNALAPPKKERGLGTTLKTAELSQRYRSSEFPQLFSDRTLATRRCVSCGRFVGNGNLGGHDGRQLSGGLWYLRCTDRRHFEL